jgi:hypothetical protein
MTLRVTHPTGFLAKKRKQIAFDAKFQSYVRKRYGSARNLLLAIGMDQKTVSELEDLEGPPDSTANLSHQAGDDNMNAEECLDGLRNQLHDMQPGERKTFLELLGHAMNTGFEKWVNEGLSTDDVISSQAQTPEGLEEDEEPSFLSEKTKANASKIKTDHTGPVAEDMPSEKYPRPVTPGKPTFKQAADKRPRARMAMDRSTLTGGVPEFVRKVAGHIKHAH